MKIVRMKLTPDDLTPASIRYNSGCDCVQQTADGGTTWTDQPSLDPRHATGFLKPPLTGSDVQCRAAENMIQHIRDSIDSVINAVSDVQAATSLLNVIAVFIPGAKVQISSGQADIKQNGKAIRIGALHGKADGVATAIRQVIREAERFYSAES